MERGRGCWGLLSDGFFFFFFFFFSSPFRSSLLGFSGLVGVEWGGQWEELRMMGLFVYFSMNIFQSSPIDGFGLG